MKKEICQLCKEPLIDDSDTYEYRGFLFHEKCFDEGVEKVDHKRNEVAEEVEHSVSSQVGGEWRNGGYKTMKTTVGGQPISKNLKEPQRLQEYESGKL